MDQIRLTQAIEGFELAANARRLSPRTLADYGNTFRKLQVYLVEDRLIDSISLDELRAFLGKWDELSKKTVLNYHTGLSALWRWATTEGFVERNLVREIKPPRPERRAIEPYSREDVRAMLKAAERSRSYRRPGEPRTSNALATTNRNRAIVLLLLDTGLRAEELASLRIGDADLRNLKVKVMGKGSRERIVKISPQTGRMIWRYLATRPKQDKVPGAPLFCGRGRRGIGRDHLYRLIRRLGDRASVPSANVHRFRHTFAIQFLRNNGNPWALQMALGHSTMDMVKRYLAIAQADLEAAHDLASPVANWDL